MKRNISIAVIILAATLGGCASEKTINDPALLGSWKGLREESVKCRFLSWKTRFEPDGKFSVTFFKDPQQTQKIQTERGTWTAADGRNALKTDGVPMPDVYTYKFVDADTVRYTSVESDPSSDCQADYTFTERRIRE